MTTDFAQHLAEDRRLVILRVLLDSAAYTANEFILQRLLESFGHFNSKDRLHVDLAWLQEQGLIELNTVGGVRIARLVGRGQDVAQGRTTVPGVQKPRAL